MVLATIGGAIAGGLASGVASSLFSKAGPKIPDPTANLPTSFTTPGFSLSRQGKNLNLTRNDDLLGQLGLLNTQQADQIGGLISRVAPGMSALRESRLAGLESVRRRTVGDIRDNLARRRVLGSSFAQDAIARAEGEFAQRADEVRATSFLQELDLTQKLIQQRTDILRSTVMAGIEQGNFEAQLTANFANRVQSVLGQVGMFQANLAAQAQSGLGALFQPAVSAIGSAVSSGVQGLFGGSSGGLVGNYSAGHT